MIKASLLAVAVMLSWGACAEDIIMAPDAFVEEAFDGQPPDSATLWLTGTLRERAQMILGHAPVSLRVRYWRQADRSAWILEEIGKESPITAGFVVEDGRLKQAEVLIYRESRGGEIRFRSFLRQFSGGRLRDNALDSTIDNISSATLSVRAMQRMASLALLLDESSR